MSNILDYIRTLAPVYERKEITTALQQLRTELLEYTLPDAKDIQEVFAEHKFKSKYMEQVSQSLRRKAVFQGSGIDTLVASVEALANNIPILEKEVKRLFAFQFATTRLTFDRANLLRYIESALFYVRYFRKMMLRIVAEEALAVGSASPMNWARAEREFLDSGLETFMAIFPSIILSESQLKQNLAKTAAAEIDPDTLDTAVASLGMGKLDPMQVHRFKPDRMNPFFSLGKSLAELKVKRYQAAKEEHQGLQLRLQEYRELAASGNANPKLQKLIQHTEQRIEKLDYQIAKIEDENRWTD